MTAAKKSDLLHTLPLVVAFGLVLVAVGGAIATTWHGPSERRFVYLAVQSRSRTLALDTTGRVWRCRIVKGEEFHCIPLKTRRYHRYD
jgi:hypothetical protein